MDYFDVPITGKRTDPNNAKYIGDPRIDAILEIPSIKNNRVATFVTRMRWARELLIAIDAVDPLRQEKKNVVAKD